MKTVAVPVVVALFWVCLHAQEPDVQSGDGERRRIFHLVPSYDVAEAARPYQPLTARGKFVLMTDRVFDRFTVAKAAARAGLGQAFNTPHYGQGWDAYGARFGAAVADSASRDFFANFLFPVALRHDPRYFRRGAGSGRYRTGYALSRIVVTRADSGRPTFNFSQWMGTLASSGLSNVYYPERDRTVRTTMTRAGHALAIEMGVNVLKEFWPDIKRKLRRKKP